eukprot:TRINITY_DN11375_c0_g1_i3.p1 TRINITY_DN11375_c0_g1~~TRINITY_DN11375_c0_g1_i3.p1  ORF type:complete len:123 (+),score=35.49 TRINITY_DN11375_c0_g1_i3:133-501(+)
MIRRPPRSTLSSSSAASDVYKRQVSTQSTGTLDGCAMSMHMTPEYERRMIQERYRKERGTTQRFPAVPSTELRRSILSKPASAVHYRLETTEEKGLTPEHEAEVMRRVGWLGPGDAYSQDMP